MKKEFDMKTITFSFNSNKYEEISEEETFTFDELNIDKNLSEETLEKYLERLHQIWVWNKLNISYSIVLDVYDEKQNDALCMKR